MAKVKIGLRGLSAQQKLEKARLIEQKVDKSKVLDPKGLPMGDLVKAGNMLEKAIEMAEFGDKRAIAAKRLCEKQLEAAIRNMGAAVEHMSKNDGSVIKSCGFEIRSTNNRSTPLGAPEAVEVNRLDKAGSVAIKWKPVANSKSYLVQTCTKAPNSKTNWQTSGFSTKSRCNIDALTPGVTYWFRVMAIGAKGIGPPSTTISIMAA